MLICTALLCSYFALYAQPKIRTERSGNDVRTDFILEGKDRPGTLTVYLTFSELRNCRMNPGTTKYAVKFNQTRLLTLRAADESYGVQYRYAYRYFYGSIDPKPDTAFVYRMPCSTQKPVSAIGSVFIIDKYSKSREEQKITGHYFLLEKGDTVYASRKGIVTKVEFPEKTNLDVSFTSEVPKVFVEHADGSLMRYNCLDRDHVFVKAGDEVLPSTPLALVGSFDGEHYKVGTLVYYYTTNPDPAKRKDELCVANYILPDFATAEGAFTPGLGKMYTPVLTDEMVTREMTKKELKSYSGNKK